MPKVLLACHQFFPRFYAGTETLVLEVADELARRGFQVEIITAEPGEADTRLELIETFYQEHKVWRILIPCSTDPLIRLEKEIRRPELKQLFRQVIQQAQPDVAHIFHLMRLTSVLLETLEENRVKTFFTATDYWWVCPKYQLVRWDGAACTCAQKNHCFGCILEIYLKRFSVIPYFPKVIGLLSRVLILVNGKARFGAELLELRRKHYIEMAGLCKGAFFSNRYIQDVFHQYGVRFSHEIVQGFPLPSRAESVRLLPLAPWAGKLKIGFIGTLRFSKGPQVLMEACALLSHRTDLEVEIWGEACDPTFERELRTKAAGRRWIKFKGTFPQEEFAEVIREIHVVVIPSLWPENTPLTALTALAGRKFLLVSDVPGLASLVNDNRAGVVFPAGDSVTLAKQIQELADKARCFGGIPTEGLLLPKMDEYVDALLEEYSRN